MPFILKFSFPHGWAPNPQMDWSHSFNDHSSHLIEGEVHARRTHIRNAKKHTVQQKKEALLKAK